MFKQSDTNGVFMVLKPVGSPMMIATYRKLIYGYRESQKLMHVGSNPIFCTTLAPHSIWGGILQRG